MSTAPETGPTRNERAGGERRRVDVRRIAGSVAICLAVVHMTQTVAGDYAMAAVVAFGACAAWIVGWRKDVLRSVRTAVVLLVALSVACIAATLTVQRSQLEHASDEEFESTVAFAWAHLLVKLSHPWPRAAELTPEQDERLATLAAVFGSDMADEQRENLENSLRAHADEERAQAIASSQGELFGVGYRVARGLRLTDLFRAWWFIALFYLLTLNLLFGALVRRKPSVRNLGFHGSHLGLILVVAGATVGGFLGERGFVALEVGEPRSQFRADGGRRAAPLGFSLRLDEFQTLYHEDLVIETGGSGAADPHHGMMGRGDGDTLTHTEKLEEGKVLELAPPDGSARYQLTMSEIRTASGLERVRRAPEAGEEGTVAAQVRIDDGEAFWIGGPESLYIDADNRFKVRAVPAGDATDGSCPDGERLGTFQVRLDGGESLAIPAAPGQTLAVGTLRATVVEVYPDFSVGGGPPLATDFPRNPAARVQLEYEGDPPRSYLFFASEELRSFTQLPWSTVQAQFDFDYWCSPTTGGRVEVRVDAEGGATARATGPDGVAESRVTGGATIPIPGTDRSLHVLEALPAAVEEIRPVFVDGEDGGALTALRLAVDDGESTEDHWLLSNTMAGTLALPEGTGEHLRLRLEDNRGRPPRDWVSTLSALEEGQVVATGDVQVNEPFCYGGYCFFQSDANPERPTYSGLQVVRDPSWTLVKVGLWMLLLGISWVFYVQPLFDRRGKRRPPAAGGEA